MRLLSARTILAATILLTGWCWERVQAQNIRALRTILEVEDYPGSNTWWLGTGMLGLGDINNDGWPDFAVSAHNVGNTFIYFGGPGILDGIPDVVLKGGDNMVMGDLNGDGKKDLVVRRSGYAFGGIDTIYIYFGKTPSPLVLDTVPGLILSGETLEDDFGLAMAVGDLNNDGFDDLAVSARDFSFSRGKVYVYLGKPDFTSFPSFTAIGDTIRSFFGYQIEIGDVNLDGLADLLISADDRRGFATLDIYYGRGGWTFVKNAFNQRLDSRNIPPISRIYQFDIVDVNIDGRKDIYCISAKTDSAFVFLGRSDSIRWSPDLIFLNPDPTFYRGFGAAAVDVGDINGDAVADFVVETWPGGGASCASLFLGKSKPPTQSVAVRCRVGSDIRITGVGDVNGDGVDDFAFSTPGYFVILSGDKTLTSVEEDRAPNPEDHILSQNYPNPFNPETTIEYTLPNRARVRLIIYDSVGKEVLRLVDQEQEKAHYKVSWDGKTFLGQKVASGVYYYNLFLNGVAKVTRKAILLK